jgi:XRE family aerobic/anaerobic benzoate catabolism transcriptional regulator
MEHQNPPQEPDQALFLQGLGDRVREARARRGMTRRILARDSGVSERYLAQLEAGQGNTSILVLQRVAHALGLTVPDLLREESERTVELLLIETLLKRLPAPTLATIRTKLMREYGAADETRRKRIALVGLRGAGKSTLGSRLARRLGVPFIELDREVELEAGTNLSEVFMLHGQQGFRRYERRALERVLENHERCVIATGGSIVSEPGTYDLLLSTCFTVWLKADAVEHMTRVAAQGDHRPMAGNAEAMDDLRRILAGRAPLYAQADVVVDTRGRDVEQSFADLVAAVPAALEIADEPR